MIHKCSKQGPEINQSLIIAAPLLNQIAVPSNSYQGFRYEVRVSKLHEQYKFSMVVNLTTGAETFKRVEGSLPTVLLMT